MSLAGKVVLVAGASGGLGQAVTPLLSQADATLILLDRTFPLIRSSIESSCPPT